MVIIFFGKNYHFFEFFVFVLVSVGSVSVFKSNERSEDSLGFADFFFSGKRLKILMHLGISALF